MIALQARAEEQVPDLSYADFSNASLQKALGDAAQFHNAFDMQGSISAILGLHNVRKTDWAEKLLRRQTLPGAILSKLGSNSFAKRRPETYPLIKDTLRLRQK